MRENAGKMRNRITSNMGTFYAMAVIKILFSPNSFSPVKDIHILYPN